MEFMHRGDTTRVLASYESYGDAQQAIDGLADRGFPVERLKIVGIDLRYEEQITGRRGYGQALLGGGGSGAVVGALLGFLFGLLELTAPLVSGVVLSLWGVLLGLLVGAVLGVTGHALTAGRRNFSSVARLTAGRYAVAADETASEEGSRVLVKVNEERALKVA